MFAAIGLGDAITTKWPLNQTVSAILSAYNTAGISIYTAFNALGAFITGLAFKGLVNPVTTERGIAFPPLARFGTHHARHVAVRTILGSVVAVIAGFALENVHHAIAARSTGQGFPLTASIANHAFTTGEITPLSD